MVSLLSSNMLIIFHSIFLPLFHFFLFCHRKSLDIITLLRGSFASVLLASAEELQENPTEHLCTLKAGPTAYID